MHPSIRNIFANFGWLVGGRAGAAILSLAYLGLATRSLGPVGFGHFALILSTAQAVTTLVTCQTWQMIVQYGHRWLAADDRGALARLVRGACYLDLGSAIAGAILVTIAILMLGPRFGLSTQLGYDAILFGWVLLLSIKSTPMGILRLHDRFAAAAAAEGLTPATRFVGAIAVTLIAPSVAGFLLAWAIAELATAVAYWISAAKTGELSEAWHTRLNMAEWITENDRILTFAATTNLASTLGLAGKQIAALLVGLFLGPAAAGGYRLVQQIALGLTKISQLLARATFPELVRLIAPGDTHGSRKLLKKISVTTAGTSITLFALLLLFGKLLLWIVSGKVDISAYPLLMILGAAGCIDLAATVFEPALIASGYATRALYFRAISTSITLSLMLILLNTMGLLGAAWGVLAGSLVSAVLLGRAAFRHVRRHPTMADVEAAENATELG